MQNGIYFGLDLISNDDLEHIGMPKRSGRYPWGSGEDPYHHGADAPGGRKKASLSERMKRRKAVRESVKKAKAEAEERKVKEEEEKAKAEREKNKQAAMSSGDPKMLAPYIRDLTDDELKSAVNRLRFENQFATLLAEAPKDPSAMDKIKKKLDKANEYATTGFNTWNNVAKIYNTFADKDDKLPMIGEGVTKKKEKSEADKSKKSSKPSTQDKTKPSDITDVKLVDDRKVLEDTFKELGVRPSSVELNAPYHATYSTGKQSNTASVYSLYNTPIAKRKKVPRLKR